MEPPPLKGRPARTSADHRTLRILLVEDEEAHAELVARAFESSNRPAILRVVSGIRAATEAVATETPDLVLADLRLPDGDGLELVVGDPGRAGYPVVIMTSHGDEQVAVDTMKAGALDYVVKSEETFSQLPFIAERALRGWFMMQEGRRAEATLREREEHFRSLIENALDLISILGPDGTVHYMSPACRRVLGYDADEVVGTTIQSHAQESDREAVEAFVTEVFARPGPHSRLFRVTGKDGEPRVLEAVGSVQPGSAALAIVNSRDVTERVRAEEEARRLEGELRQAQKLETLGTLAGGIAHDFNNILQAIHGCADLARGAESREEANAYLSRLLEASDRARQLVQRILTFGRRTEQELRPVMLAPIVQEVVELLQATLPKAVKIRCAVRGDLTVRADPSQVHQVLVNLCTNAQHAMEERGGILEIDLDRIEDGEAPGQPSLGPGRWAELTVRDTGQGMTAAVRERIFEPFFTTKGVGRGSGLGLSVAHGIVAGHRGVIRVESEPGRGAAFHVYLPEAEPASAFEAAPAAAMTIEGRQVLYVDDEPLVAATVRELLEKHGARVVACSGPADALEAARLEGASFDVAILDYTMPQMTGGELARGLRELRPELPIVIVSGYGEAINRARLLSLGASSYLPKPFGGADLLRAVAEALAPPARA